MVSRQNKLVDQVIKIIEHLDNQGYPSVKILKALVDQVSTKALLVDKAYSLVDQVNISILLVNKVRDLVDRVKGNFNSIHYNIFT